MSDPEKFEVEYGSMRPLSFVNMKMRTHDAEGNEIDMNCKCGKPGNVIMSKDAFLIRCPECGWT